MRLSVAALVLFCCGNIANAQSVPCADGKGLTSPFDPTACCPKACGSCGGKGCGTRSGGESACCGSNILAKNTACGTPPCVIRKPDQGLCKTSLLNGDESVCCSSKCGALCGKKGCSGAGGGEKGCCASAIQASGKLCSNNAALPSDTQGCILKTASIPPTTQPTSTPTDKPTNTTKPTNTPTGKPTSKPTTPGVEVCDEPNPKFVPGVGCVDGSRECAEGLYPFTELWQRPGTGLRRAEFCEGAASFQLCAKDNKILTQDDGGLSCISKSAKCAISKRICSSFPIGGQTCIDEKCVCDDPDSVITRGQCLKKCGTTASGVPIVCIRGLGDVALTECVNGKCQCGFDGTPAPLKTCPVIKDDLGATDFAPQVCSTSCTGS